MGYFYFNLHVSFNEFLPDFLVIVQAGIKTLTIVNICINWHLYYS